MNKEIIIGDWKMPDCDTEASMNMWNARAQEFAKQKGVEDDDWVAALVKRHGMLPTDGTFLDVGCGAGKYTVYFAKKCAEAYGTDFSEEMIKNAGQRAKESGVDNAFFSRDNWHTLELAEKGWKGKFDLVVANMTPAIQSAETFEKLTEASCGWCLYIHPVLRTGSVADRLKKKIFGKKPNPRYPQLQYAFNLLWEKGLFPAVEYREHNWVRSFELERAVDIFKNDLRSKRTLTAEEEASIEKYLIEHAVNGIVEEEVRTTQFALYWEV